MERVHGVLAAGGKVVNGGGAECNGSLKILVYTAFNVLKAAGLSGLGRIKFFS